jgi:hypothetical protein
LSLLGPLDAVGHLFLNLVDPLQRVHALVQEEGGVVHQHVNELDELLSGSGINVIIFANRYGTFRLITLTLLSKKTVILDEN